MIPEPEPSRPHPSRRLAHGALGVVLLWNSLAGLVASRRPGVFGDELSLAFDRFGVLAPSAPTAYAGLWLAAWGLFGVWLARRGDPRWHGVAALFYAAQVIAVLRPLQICFWTGLYVSVPIGSVGTGLVAINAVSLVLLASHLRSLWSSPAALDQAAAAVLRTRGATLGVVALARQAWLRCWGTPALTRSAVARRFATLASLAALVVPLCASLAADGVPILTLRFAALWLAWVVMPSFVLAYLLAAPRGHSTAPAAFSALRGAGTAIVTLGAAMLCTGKVAFEALDGQGPLAALFFLVFLGVPLLFATVVLGAFAGSWLARRCAEPVPVWDDTETASGYPERRPSAAPSATRSPAARR